MAFTSYQTGRLYLVGVNSAGQTAFHERFLARAMGLWADPQRLVVSTLFQVWRFENVLSGEFGDNLGTYPAGTWIRNPVGSEHAPFSREGAVLYVKSGHLLKPELWSRPAA